MHTAQVRAPPGLLHCLALDARSS